jgi:hypothetical protein
MNIFGFKIMRKAKYKAMLDIVVEQGKEYRKIAGDDYHTKGRYVSVKLSSLGRICLLENLFWSDIKEKVQQSK